MMNDPYHIYMDLDVINNDFSSATKPQLRFEETRNTPFLPGDSADYFCSIIRFNIQTGNSLPVFIPRIQTGQPDVNKTIYTVTFKYANHKITVPIMYEPEDQTAPLPAPPTVKQDISSAYYFVYNYQHFINLVNTALKNAWSTLPSSLSTIWDSAFDKAVAPFFDYDVGTNRVILSADERLGKPVSGTMFLELQFNERLYELFAGLPSRLAIDNSLPYYRISIIDRTYNKVAQKVIVNNVTETIYMLQVYQEMSSIALWNPVSSIVFASSLLPIVPTQTSAPKDLGGNNLVSGGNNSNLLPTLSDFSIAVDANNQYRPMVEYNPGAEYRLIDVNSTMNLNRIDIIVYWKDRHGTLHPFNLQPGCSASVKLMFRRKDFNVFQ
jgi:hypothetical protein